MESPDFGEFASLVSSQPVSVDLCAPLRTFLDQNPRLRFLRLQWQDHSGLLRTRMIPPKRVIALTDARKLIHMPPIAFHCVVDNCLVPNLDPTGSHWLVPDWSSLRVVPFSPRYAVVICGVVGATPARPLPNLDLCPRTALATVLRRAAGLFHLDFQVGFEVEFEIMQRSPPPSDPMAKGYLVPASHGLGRYAVAGLRDPQFVHVEEVMERLLDSGVDIQAVQTEGRRGQYEFSLGPRTPLEAVDELLTVHDTLKTMLGRHGYVATMAPRPVENRRQATGQHTHISISSVEHENEFLAGIMDRLRAICAVCMPYDLSYERVQPYLAGNMISWGTENREVPVRKIKAGHWELRCVDATANMYLALAVVLGAGLLGIEKRQPLHWPDTAYDHRGDGFKPDGHDKPTKNPHMNGTQPNGTQPNGTQPNGTQTNGAQTNGAQTNGVQTDCVETNDVRTIPDRLPRCLDEALDALEKECPELQRIMDNRTILPHYISLKRFEASRLAGLEPEYTRDLLSELF